MAPHAVGSVDQQYLDHLRVERGLSPNTLEAYGRDVARLGAFAAAQHRALLDLAQADISRFIGQLRDEGLSARSVARAVHGLRGLFRFAVREGHLVADPMENIKAPRAFNALPRCLSMTQVESLLDAPDVTKPLGVRDRAILEVLYATGLRVSELIGLRPSDVDLEVGLLTCFGKGRKERLVPLGSTACTWVRRYMDEVRGGLGRGRGRGAVILFLNHRGGPRAVFNDMGQRVGHLLRAAVPVQHAPKLARLSPVPVFCPV